MEIKSYYYKNKISKINIKLISLDKFLTSFPPEEEVISAAARIKKFGLCYPLCVRKNITKNGEFFLFDNIVSFLALKYLGVDKVPVLIFSYTMPEAVIFYLLHNDDLNIFKKAELYKILLKKGNYTVKELCDIFKISPSRLDVLLLPLSLKEKEKSIFITKKLGYFFLKEFLKIPLEKRSEFLNTFVAENLSEKEGLRRIEEILNPKEKPLKATCLKNDIVIMNSIKKLSSNLKTFGISSSIEKSEEDGFFKYSIIVESSPNQLCFDFESIS